MRYRLGTRRGGQGVGAGGVLPPLVAAWFPNLLFGAGAAWLLKRTRT